jgi:hypothetical protein
MELEEAIELLKQFRDVAKQNIDYIEGCKLTDFLDIKYNSDKQEYDAINLVLKELGRLSQENEELKQKINDFVEEMRCIG